MSVPAGPHVPSGSLGALIWPLVMIALGALAAGVGAALAAAQCRGQVGGVHPALVVPVPLRRPDRVQVRVPAGAACPTA